MPAEVTTPDDLDPIKAALAATEARVAALENAVTALGLSVTALTDRVTVLEKPAPEPQPSRKPLNVGIQYTAMWSSHFNDVQRQQMVNMARDTGCGWVRLDVAWATMQPNPGPLSTYGVSTIEPHVDRALAAGLKVLLEVYWAPEWATPGTGQAAAPDPAAFGEGMKLIAARFKGKVDAYEIWNEQNGSRFLSPPDPAIYTGMLKAAYAGVKASDPSALVVMGGVEYVDTDFLKGMYAAGAKGHFDVAACHPYQAVADLSPDAPYDGSKWTIPHLDEWIKVMAANGDTSPVWLTEFGWSTHPNVGGEKNWDRGVTEQAQADYLYRMFELCRDRWPRVEGLFWYTAMNSAESNIQQASYGLLRRDGSAKPAVAALARAVQDFAV